MFVAIYFYLSYECNSFIIL